MLGCIAPATELNAPTPASIGAFLASIFGAPPRPCLVACPNLSKRPPLNSAPPPGNAVGPTTAGAVTGVGAAAPAPIDDISVLFITASMPAAVFAPAPAPVDPNLVAKCCASAGLFAGLATPRPILAPKTPALSLNKPAALPPRIEPPAPTAPARPAPPKAPRPAIRPLLKSPVSAVCPAATIPAASGAPIPVAARPKPMSVGRSLPSQPASGRPVCGLIVREPPCAIASCCRPLTSPGVMCTSILSSPRP